MDNIIEQYNLAVDWLVSNGYKYENSYNSCNGKTYDEFRNISNLELIYRLPTADDFDNCEQELFRNYIKGHTDMKTTFTLQDLQSIPKQKWLDYIEKHATQDVIADMYEWHKKWGKSYDGGDRKKDGYRIAHAGYGLLILTFIEEKIYSRDINDLCKKNEKCVLDAIMEDINYLVMALFRLNLDSPLIIANKVVEMLNELINNQTQGK